MENTNDLDHKPKIGDIVFTHVDGKLVEMEIKDENTLNILSIEYPPDKNCKHQNGTFPEPFLCESVIFHRCNDCGRIMFHTSRTIQSKCSSGDRK